LHILCHYYCLLVPCYIILIPRMIIPTNVTEEIKRSSKNE